MDDFAHSFDFKSVFYQGRSVQVPVSRYRYEQLDVIRRQIRLLRFLNTRHPTGIIRFQIEKYDLSEAVPYVALSYQWGDPSRYSVVLVDDVPFAVTRNLFDALRRLEQPGLALWVDAICIDQSNDNEKGSQVPLIRSIYQGATLTWVWLGNAADGSERVMEILNSIAKGRVPRREHMRKLRPQLFDFFRREYWQRVWIIQEIAVSRNTLLVCGDDTIWWEALEQFLVLASRDKNLVFSDFAMVQHLRLVKFSLWGLEPLGFLQVLSSSSATKATDLRDKVFALFGICSDAVTFTATPSYRWSEPEMCFRLVQNAFRAKDMTDIIFTASHTTNMSSLLPTWVPDLLNFGTDHIQRLLSAYIYGACKPFLDRQQLQWQATASSHFIRCRPTVGGKTLTLRGRLLGRVQSLGVSVLHAKGPESPATLLPRGRLVSHWKESICRAFTLYHCIGDKDTSADVLFGLSARNTLPHCRQLRQWARANKKMVLHGRTLGRTLSQYLEREQSSSESRLALIKIPLVGVGILLGVDMLTVNHALAGVSNPNPTHSRTRVLDAMKRIISEGMLLAQLCHEQIGWVHPSSQLRDEVWLLEGCTMPAVLRRPPGGTPETFQLVGHAYVVGVMQGEVWSKLRQEELERVVLI